MTYFKINDVDYSHYVGDLKISTATNYSAQTNAAGNTVVDYINKKRSIEVGIIPLDAEAMKELQTAIDGFNVNISFMNPKTNAVEENINCIIPDTDVSYYTIRVDKVSFNAATLTFTEL